MMTKAISIALMVVVLMVSGVVLDSAPVLGAKAAPPPASTSKGLNLFFGSTTSISGTYIWAVAWARVVNKYVPGISITVVESGASYDDMRRIREGLFDGGLASGYRGTYEMLRGLETFQGDAWKEIRFLHARDLSTMRMYTRADSGVKTWADLNGKRIAGGIPGSLANIITVRTVEALGLKCTVVPGSLGDGIRDVLQGRLAAVMKSGLPEAFDAALVASHLKVPHIAIGYTDQQAAILMAKYPYWGYKKTPANYIREMPGHAPIWECWGPAGGITSSRLPQDIGYRITKAVYEHWDEIVKAYPGSAKIDPIKDYVNFVAEGAETPLHAGVVQYAKEKGIEMRKAFIPPEYRPK